LVTVVTLLIFTPTSLQASQLHVTIDGKQVNFTDQGPTIVDGRTLVPVRGVFEELGFEVDWEQDTETARLTRSGYEVVLTIGSANFITNGESHTLDVPAQIIGGRTMLPIRAVLESVGYSVGWSQSTNTVLISSSNGQSNNENGINENGLWGGVRALDYVEIFDYNNLEIPRNVHYVSDRQVELEIQNFLFRFPFRDMERAVVKGDSVNIDYVAIIDGQIFQSERDVYVCFGIVDFSDEFLEHLIGHMPGDTVHVVMPFPDNEPADLAGKDVLFDATINFIVSEGQPRLSDNLVLENLYDLYGWTTIREMEEGIRKELQRWNILAFVHGYMINEVNISSIPEQWMRHQEQLLISSIESGVAVLGITVDEYLEMIGFNSMDEFLEFDRVMNLEFVRFRLVIQAIAEHGGFSVNREDVGAFLEEHSGIRDYSSFLEEVGLPTIIQIILQEKVLNHIVENAVLL